MSDSTTAREALGAATIDRVTVVGLARIAAAEFVRKARIGDDPRDFRIDLYRQVEVPDRAVSMLGRPHSVAVRIKITCESMLFDGAGQTMLVVPAPSA